MTISEGGAWRSPDVARYMPTVVNVSDDAFYGNIRSATARDLPWLQPSDAHEGHAVLVGGGPSLIDTLEDIRRRYENGQTIFALNNTASWLIERGILPHYHILLDARPSVARFVQNEKIEYLVASQCHPDVFEAAKNVTLWHPNVEGIREIIGDRPAALIGGGTTVGMQAMAIAYTMGFRTLHLHGYDSSYRGDAGHAYAQAENDADEIIKVHFGGQDFISTRWMVNQADEFKNVVVQLANLDCIVTVAGDGLIPAIAKKLSEPPPKILTAVYDLYCSPPSYDFLSFLCAAEQARQEGGFTAIDIVFQPGPKFGFRNDDLPPDTQTRDAMLWRICVPACRLLPSVRDVSVYRERREITGDVFPEGWAFHNPVSCYGTHLVKRLPRALRATEKARQTISERKPYVTITLRNCDYHPERNSQLDEWKEAAVQIGYLGYEVVWLHDTKDSLDARAWDIDLRMALYEGAACNLMVVNGPIDLLRLSDAPYLAFKPLVERSLCQTIEFYRANGVEVGDQFGPNGRMVWEDDTAEVIIREFKAFITK